MQQKKKNVFKWLVISTSCNMLSMFENLFIRMFLTYQMNSYRWKPRNLLLLNGFHKANDWKTQWCSKQNRKRFICSKNPFTFRCFIQKTLNTTRHQQHTRLLIVPAKYTLNGISNTYKYVCLHAVLSSKELFVDIYRVWLLCVFPSRFFLLRSLMPECGMQTTLPIAQDWYIQSS